MFTTFGGHLLIKTCNLPNILCVIVQDSDAQGKTAFTLELNISVALPINLDFHSLFIATKVDLQ